MGAKRWLTWICNGLRLCFWQEMSGLCRNPEQIDSTTAIRLGAPAGGGGDFGFAGQPIGNVFGGTIRKS
jgi:hypothetical protein